MSEANETTESAPSREWTKFIILVVILLATVLVLVLARPLIFNRIVPAVMGEGQLTAPMPAAEPAVDAENEAATEEAYPAAPENSPDAAAYPAAESAEEENVAEEQAVNGETAVAPISHTVQHGDTLLNIARRYGVTVEAITAANNISNPNHIEVGTTLIIPQP